MTAPSKYLFDLDFANRAAGSDAERSAPHGAAAAGYDEGLAAGRKEAEMQSARLLALAVEQMAQALTRLDSEMRDIENRMQAEAVAVAVAVGRKLAHELLAREPLAEIESLIRTCLQQLTATPHVAIRVSDRLYPALLEKLDHISGESGYQNRLVVLAESDIRDGDCRIEWADGGMIRDRDRIEATIAESVQRFIDARHPRPDISKGIAHE